MKEARWKECRTILKGRVETNTATPHETQLYEILATDNELYILTTLEEKTDLFMLLNMLTR